MFERKFSKRLGNNRNMNYSTTLQRSMYVLYILIFHQPVHGPHSILLLYTHKKLLFF